MSFQIEDHFSFEAMLIKFLVDIYSLHLNLWVVITMAVFLMKLAVNNSAVFLIKWQ
jgi:hypothetical protein